jgi:predicted protein tyrosine phosphatase
MRVLFVCTANISRSPAAEEVFRVLSWGLPGQRAYDARSAGTDPNPGGRAITRADVEWADVICVMETHHAEFIEQRWPDSRGKIRVFGVPDVYQPGDDDLRDVLAQHIRALLVEHREPQSRAL